QKLGDQQRPLEEFMPRVLTGERPGMAFNLSYGVQGQARYTHVPGILEMVGIPYVGSGPLAHSLALDKVVAKMIFRQNDLPTPDFAVLNEPGFPSPSLSYPLIVKPKNEAVSMGIRIVNNEEELREAALVIFDTFEQPVLAERYIEGREINVGLLGNNPAEALPPCEIVFGEGGPAIYTIDDKKGVSGREINWLCPAPISQELTEKAKEIAVRGFAALGCFDCARVDMRLDADGNFYILEINSLPSLGEHGSYTIAAKEIGLDFPSLISRLVDTASARYFGTPTPPVVKPKETDLPTLIFSFLSRQRDLIERRLEEWVAVTSRTSDPIRHQTAIKKLDKELKEMKLQPVEDLTNASSAWTWETKGGLDGGTLFIGHSDVPLDQNTPTQLFRREPEWLYGEGIGISRAPLVMLEFALRSLRNQRLLHKLPIGVLFYMDEGRDCRYSAEIIRRAASRARRVFILRPGTRDDKVIIQRRGQIKYRLVVEGKTKRLGQHPKIPEVLLWVCDRLGEISNLSSPKEKLSVSAVNIKADAFPMLLPHRLTVDLMLSYLDKKMADEAEDKIKEMIVRKGLKCDLAKVSDRPPMKERRHNLSLAKGLSAIADKWDIPFGWDSSVWPSAGGLVPARVPVVCGIGPTSRDLYTPQEAVNRTCLIQRTLLIAQFLVHKIGS
ncbi:ATP-grasp domain-containing protein, partial [Thermodesulfobacteriota bacterium]